MIKTILSRIYKYIPLDSESFKNLDVLNVSKKGDDGNSEKWIYYIKNPLKHV